MGSGEQRHAPRPRARGWGYDKTSNNDTTVRAELVELANQVNFAAAAVTFGGMHGVGDMVLGTDGQWMIRPTEKCSGGHLLAGHCIVACMPCSCQDRHPSWSCDGCGHTTYEPGAGGRTARCSTAPPGSGESEPP